MSSPCWPGAEPFRPAILLRTPPLQSASGDEVVREGWWRVAGQPHAVLTWIRAHRPAGSTDNGTGGLGRPVGW